MGPKENQQKAAIKPVVKKKAPAKPAAKKEAKKEVAKPTKVVRVSTRKAYTRPQFRRNHTYRKPATVKPSNNMKTIKDPWDAFRVIKYPLSTDMAMKKIEENNTLTFIVDSRANKTQIKKAIRKLYNVKTAKVNTLIRPDGLKKAYIRLAAVHDALDIANKIGIV
jgi:large subunit ribosomal protein L23Ae